MSIWHTVQALVANVANGLAQANGFPQSNGRQRGRILRLCRDLGWLVDEEDGQTISLHFTDREAMGGIRKVCIALGDTELPVFFSLSHAIIPARQAEEVAAYLLARCHQMELGGWAVGL